MKTEKATVASMSKYECINMIKRSVTEWNEYISAQREQGIGFEPIDSSLAFLDLQGIDFKGINLSGSTFNQTNLKNADFSETELVEVCFDGADLTNANFRDANLKDCFLKKTILENTNFCQASLLGAAEDLGSYREYGDYYVPFSKTYSYNERSAHYNYKTKVLTLDKVSMFLDDWIDQFECIAEKGGYSDCERENFMSFIVARCDRRENSDRSNFINLTPHPIAIYSNGIEVFTIPISGKIARIEQSYGTKKRVNTVSVFTTSFGEILGLPEVKEDCTYIVSLPVLLSLASYNSFRLGDCVAPNTNGGVVRDGDGRIIGVTSLLNMATI